MNSKKHKDMVLRVGEEDLGRIKEKAKVVLKKDEVEVEVEEEDEMEVEEVDSDEWEEDEPIPVNDCVFCSHHSAHLDNNMK